MDTANMDYTDFNYSSVVIRVYPGPIQLSTFTTIAAAVSPAAQPVNKP